MTNRTDAEAKARYESFAAEVEALEIRLRNEKGLDLFLYDGAEAHNDALTHDLYDEGHNVVGKVEEGTAPYWDACYGQALSMAGHALEEAGLSINDLLGRVVF